MNADSSSSNQRLADVLRGIAEAATPHELEARFRSTFDVWRHQRTKERIRKAVRLRGRDLCGRLDKAGMIPRYAPRSTRLTLCGETYRVGRGYNSTGVQYVSTGAHEWMRETLRRHECPDALARLIMDWWGNYPHRALRAVLRHQRRLSA